MKRGVDQLYDAIQASDLVAARLAIATADVAGTLIDGKSYLRMASETGNAPMGQLLLDHGADINERSGARQYSLLHNAVAARDYGFARCLLELGANPSSTTSSRATPLHFAARSAQGYMARKLLDFSADINARDSQGRTPLFLAVSKGDVEISKLLLDCGCDASIANTRGQTPLQLAASLADKSIATLLGQSPGVGHFSKVAERGRSDSHYRS